MSYRNVKSENAWVFNHEPTRDEIMVLLSDTPAWHGSTINMDDYIGYVVSISQTMGRDSDKKTVWRLYTTVSGKIAILHDCHMVNGELVSWQEQISLDYRNGMVIVQGTLVSPLYGTRFEVGTGVVGDGSRGADKTNPVENAMTSWRGRAASALCGAGVLPYTGIASAEEVRTAQSREEMADRGYRVVTLDTPRREPEPEAAVTPEQNDNMRRVLDSLMKQRNFTPERAEEVYAEYIRSRGMEFTGSALEEMVKHGMEFLNESIKWCKDNGYA